MWAANSKQWNEIEFCDFTLWHGWCVALRDHYAPDYVEHYKFIPVNSSDDIGKRLNTKTHQEKERESKKIRQAHA